MKFDKAFWHGVYNDLSNAQKRERAQQALISYKRSRRYAPVFITHLEPVRSGTIKFNGINVRLTTL